jgi:hypothetical protein
MLVVIAVVIIGKLMSDPDRHNSRAPDALSRVNVNTPVRVVAPPALVPSLFSPPPESTKPTSFGDAPVILPSFKERQEAEMKRLKKEIQKIRAATDMPTVPVQRTDPVPPPDPKFHLKDLEPPAPPAWMPKSALPASSPNYQLGFDANGRPIDSAPSPYRP